MAQIFHRSTNTLAKVSIFGAVFFIAVLTWAFTTLDRSSYNTRQGVILEQPVPFSHAHHVGGLGIDCRYCHASVEQSSFAGMPQTSTCMNCHRLIWNDSPMLEPVRESYRTGVPIRWTRVNDLPDYVYFNHRVHIAKGIGCDVCHGEVDEMPLMRQEASLQMEWCLDCHRDPARYLRPRDEVFNMDWEAADQAALGARLARDYDLAPPELLTSCSTCHR